jgi:hypothetical protein
MTELGLFAFGSGVAMAADAESGFCRHQTELRLGLSSVLLGAPTKRELDVGGGQADLGGRTAEHLGVGFGLMSLGLRVDGRVVVVLGNDDGDYDG